MLIISILISSVENILYVEIIPRFIFYVNSLYANYLHKICSAFLVNLHNHSKISQKLIQAFDIRDPRKEDMKIPPHQ